jgi:hypothetical protein
MSNETAGTTRIEVPNELFPKLDAIKNKEYIAGKGHGGTIQFLIAEHEKVGTINALIDKRLEEIPDLIRDGIEDALKQFFINLVTTKPRDESNHGSTATRPRY